MYMPTTTTSIRPATGIKCVGSPPDPWCSACKQRNTDHRVPPRGEWTIAKPILLHRLATHLATRACALSTSCGDMSMAALFAPRPDHRIVCFVLHLCSSKHMLRLCHRRRGNISLRRLPIRTVITVSPGAWQLYRTVSDIGPSDDSCPPLRISPPTRGEQISGSAFTTGSLKSTVTSLHTWYSTAERP